MENKLILSLDLGTQSARAILIDEKGNLIAKEQKNILQPIILLKMDIVNKIQVFILITL